MALTYDRIEDRTTAFIEAAGLPVEEVATFTVPVDIRGGEPLDVVGMVLRKPRT